jgi:hypothetical protein
VAIVNSGPSGSEGGPDQRPVPDDAGFSVPTPGASVEWPHSTEKSLEHDTQDDHKRSY